MKLTCFSALTDIQIALPQSTKILDLPLLSDYYSSKTYSNMVRWLFSLMSLQISGTTASVSSLSSILSGTKHSKMTTHS